MFLSYFAISSDSEFFNGLKRSELTGNEFLLYINFRLKVYLLSKKSLTDKYFDFSDFPIFFTENSAFIIRNWDLKSK